MCLLATTIKENLKRVSKSVKQLIMKSRLQEHSKKPFRSKK